jgi:hypothetical protein
LRARAPLFAGRAGRVSFPLRHYAHRLTHAGCAAQWNVIYLLYIPLTLAFLVYAGARCVRVRRVRAMHHAHA